MWKAWSSLSFLKTGAGRVSIKFPLRFRTVKCTRQSRPSIFGMQLLAKWSSLNCVRWSSFSIFSIMWLFKFSWRSFLRFSKFSIYWKKVMKKKTSLGYYPWVRKNLLWVEVKNPIPPTCWPKDGPMHHLLTHYLINSKFTVAR